MSDNAIDLLGAREATTERLVKIIGQELDNAIDSRPEWARDADDYCADGLALPKLNLEEVYRYPSPTNKDRSELARQKQLGVAAYVGFIGDATNQNLYSATADGVMHDTVWPFGAAILFNDVAQEDMNAPASSGQTRVLHPNETMYMRGMRYLDALQYVLKKYGCYSNTMSDTVPRSDLPISGQVEVGDGDYALWGMVYYEFDVELDVLFPAHTQLP